MFERAVALDPQYALAHAYLAFVQVAVAGYASASRAVLEASSERAAHAVDLDPQESRCHRLLGLIWVFGRQHEAAERQLQRALELNPNDADGLQHMGHVLALRGRCDEALEWMTAARRLNPYHPTWYHQAHGIALYSLRRFEEATQVFSRWPKLGLWRHARLAACYAQLGKVAETQAEVKAVLRSRPDFSIETCLREGVPLERAEDRELFREGLIKAGLPE